MKRESKRPKLIRVSPEFSILPNRHSGAVQAVCADSKGEWALSGGKDGVLRIWGAQQGETLDWWHAHDGGIWALINLPARGQVVSAGHDQLIRVWNGPRSDCHAVLKGHEGFVYRVCALPNGYVASAGSDRTIRIWCLERKRSLLTMVGHSRLVSALAPVGDRHLLSASADGSLRLWDVETGTSVRAFLGHRQDVLAIAVAPDAMQAVSTGADGELRLWNLRTGECLAHVAAHTPSAEIARVSGRGAFISAGWDGRVRWWGEGLTAKKQVKAHHGAVRALEAGPAGLFTGGAEGVVRLLDATTGKSLSQWNGPSPVTALAPLGAERVIAGFTCGSAVVLGFETPKVVPPRRTKPKTKTKTRTVARKPGSTRKPTVRRAARR